MRVGGIGVALEVKLGGRRVNEGVRRGSRRVSENGGKADQGCGSWEEEEEEERRDIMRS